MFFFLENSSSGLIRSLSHVKFEISDNDLDDKGNSGTKLCISSESEGKT